MKDGKTVVDDERWIVVGHGQGQCVVGDWQGATHVCMLNKHSTAHWLCGHLCVECTRTCGEA